MDYESCERLARALCDECRFVYGSDETLACALEKFFSGMPEPVLAEIKRQVARFANCPGEDELRQWHEHNRQYQRNLAIKASEQRIAECKDTLSRITSKKHTAYLRKEIAKQEEALARIRQVCD